MQTMSESEPLIRNISDTARWVAVYRARESERPDAVFRDPYARKLAGERGEQIAKSIPFAEKTSWPFVARTWSIDAFLTEELARGVDMVVCLAAGLDARPYRMALPPALQWIEIDFPAMLEYKALALAGETPVCRLERIPLDLREVEKRREIFAGLGGRAKRVLVLAEGLLVYLTEEEVGALARDLAAPPSFQSWVIDLGSPALLQMLQKQMGAPLDQAGTPMKFSPEQGPEFFSPCGWKFLEARSALHTAAKLKRLPLFLRLIASISSQQFQAKRPWSAVCLLGRR